MTTEIQMFDDVVKLTKQLSPEYRLKLMEILTQTLWEIVPRNEEMPLQNGEWPSNFFEETAGAWQGEPLIRAPQGEYEVRAELQ